MFIRNFLFLFLLCGLLACNGSNSTTTSNSSTAAANEYLLTEYPQGGISNAKKIDSAGNLTEEGSIVNGKKHGAWIVYHVTRTLGIPKTITNYHNGVMNGPYMEFTQGGSLELQIFYANGQPHGPKRKYNHSRVVESANYVEGKLNGEYTTYYSNGNVQQTSNYANGIKHGNAIYYNEAGEVMFEYQYDNGKKIE